jgi:hypothetical protein
MEKRGKDETHSKKYKTKVKKAQEHMSQKNITIKTSWTLLLIILFSEMLQNFPRKRLKHVSYSKIQVFLSKCDNVIENIRIHMSSR